MTAADWHRLRPGLRTLVAVAAITVTGISAYVATYYHLSRRGLEEKADFDMEGFLYTPLAEASATHDLTLHYQLRTFFAPANYIDRHMFGGPQSISGITWSLTVDDDDAGNSQAGDN